jgi:ATP-dependent helicase YprA (DUF1998 family)
VNVFDLDDALIRDYERFARSFTKIRAKDIREQVESLYSSDRFWPEPLISINPRFEPDKSVNELVQGGTLHANTARIFSIDGKAITLHRHQAQAVAKAASGQSYVVTTEPGPESRCVSSFQSSTPRSALVPKEKPHAPAPSSFIQ